MKKEKVAKALIPLTLAAILGCVFYSRLIDDKDKSGMRFIGSYKMGAESIYLYHVSVSAYPIPEPDLVRLKEFLNQFVTAIANEYRLEPEYFVQTEYVIVGGWPELLSKYGSYWKVETGLGMRPDWSSLKAKGALKRLFTKSPAPSELVYRLSRDEHFERFFPGLKWLSAVDVYLGSGGVAICMASDGEKFLERTRQFYLTDLDSAYRHLDFYFPIIDIDDFEKVSEKLTKVWFGFFDVYIAETKSDPGILIASRHNLGGLMARFQPVLESEKKR